MTAGWLAYHEPDPLEESKFLDAGDQIVFDVSTAAGTTGTGYFVLTVRDLPFAESPDNSIARSREFTS